MRGVRGRPDPVGARNTGQPCWASLVGAGLRSAGSVQVFRRRSSLNAYAICYAAIFADDVAASELKAMVPLRPVGKNPPCVALALPPNAR